MWTNICSLLETNCKCQCILRPRGMNIVGLQIVTVVNWLSKRGAREESLMLSSGLLQNRFNPAQSHLNAIHYYNLIYMYYIIFTCLIEIKGPMFRQHFHNIHRKCQNVAQEKPLFFYWYKFDLGHCTVHHLDFTQCCCN